MKIGLIGAMGLVVGLGGGAGWGALQTRDALLAARAEEHAKETEATPAVDHDPLESLSEPARSAADTACTNDSLGAGDGVPGEGAAPGALPEPGAHAVEGDSAATSAMPAAAVPAESIDGDGARRLGKIFAAMKPADAAGVLGQMSDAEAAAVLLGMSERQAAPILGSLPAERAAVLGRVVLAGRGVGH